MVEGSPALLQLRLLQVLGERSGNTVVVGVPPQTIPILLQQRETPPLPRETARPEE